MTAALIDTPEQGSPRAPAPGRLALVDAGEPVDIKPWQLRNMWALIEPTITCWLWRGNVDDEGYGKHDGRGAHVVVFERLIGTVPDGLELDHLCSNRLCVNPAHLEPVTHGDNMRRSRQRFVSFTPRRQQTHCKRDHEFTPENTRLRSNGQRECLACKALRRDPVADVPGRSSA